MPLPARTRTEPGVLEAAALAVDHLDALVLGTVRDLHGAIAARVPAPHRIHDGIAAGVYAGLGLGFRGAARALRAAEDLGVGPPVEATGRGRFVVSAVNGLIGDQLSTGGSRLAIEAGVRVHGRDVPITPDGLAAAYPEATGALVVFLHGLCETESYWRRRSRPERADGSTGSTYGERLAEQGWTPVYLRTNSGLPVAESGVAVSSLLGRLVEAWPVGVRRIALVGHSQGGLIAHAAMAVARSDSGAWTDLLTDLVALGTPHTGSPVERSIAHGVRLANLAPELAPFARIFEQRSAGVLDLALGLPEEPVPLPGVRYHLVAATLSRSPRHPVAATLGDSLVPYRSALGLLPGGRELFPGADTLHLPGCDHFDLLNHDDVHTALASWLAPSPLTQENR